MAELWATAEGVQALLEDESRRGWREKLNVYRGKRIEHNREEMLVRQSLWRVWRAELPAGPHLRAAAMSRLRVWAGYLDPDFSHSQRVSQLALLLYDGLKDAGLVAANLTAEKLAAGSAGALSPDYDARAVLQAAAL